MILDNEVDGILNVFSKTYKNILLRLPLLCQEKFSATCMRAHKKKINF